MFISLIDANKRPPIEEVSAMLNGGIATVPGIIPAVRPQPSLEISTGATNTNLGAYAYTLSGLDTDAIYKAAQQLQGAMYQSGLFASVKQRPVPEQPAGRDGYPPRSCLGVRRHGYELCHDPQGCLLASTTAT